MAMQPGGSAWFWLQEQLSSWQAQPFLLEQLFWEPLSSLLAVRQSQLFQMPSFLQQVAWLAQLSSQAPPFSPPVV